MAKYIKETSRISIKFINADTEETLFEVPDRNWMNIGEFFTDHTVTQLMEAELKNKLKNKPIPKNILVIAVGEFKLSNN